MCVAAVDSPRHNEAGCPVPRDRTTRDLCRVPLDVRCAAVQNPTKGSKDAHQRAAPENRSAAPNIKGRIHCVRLAECAEGIPPLHSISVAVLRIDDRGSPVPHSADGDGRGRTVDVADNAVLYLSVLCDRGGHDELVGSIGTGECAERHRARREGGEDAWGKCP